MAKSLLCVALAFGLLAGCGGGGGAGADGPVAVPAPSPDRGQVSPSTSDPGPNSPSQKKSTPSVQVELSDRTEALLARYSDAVARERFTDPDALPRTGAARFDGTAGLTIGGDTVLSDTDALAAAQLLSRLALKLDFKENALSGRIDEVFDKKTDAEYDGALSIAGTLRRGTDPSAQAGLRGRAEGALSRNGRTLDLTLDLAGDVLSGGSAVAGGLTGVARSRSGVQGVQGGFLADR